MKRTLTKAGRLLLLQHLKHDGVLESLTLQEIGDVFGVNRSTVLRDLREIDAAEAEYHRLLATQPWIQREFTTGEVAAALGLSADTVRALINDGLMRAVKRDEQWRIARAELERWQVFAGPKPRVRQDLLEEE